MANLRQRKMPVEEKVMTYKKSKRVGDHRPPGAVELAPKSRGTKSLGWHHGRG
jgi:hypothetical protein